MSVLVHSARLVDCNGLADDNWVVTDGAQIAAVGIGDDWRRHVDGVAGAVEVIDAAGSIVSPGFIDLHVHGGGGRSFEDGAAAITEALAVHREHGTTRSL